MEQAATGRKQYSSLKVMHSYSKSHDASKTLFRITRHAKCWRVQKKQNKIIKADEPQGLDVSFELVQRGL